MRKDQFHIIPCNDTRKHKKTIDCWCKPIKEKDDEFTECYKHNPLDGREGFEQAKKILGLEAGDKLHPWEVIVLTDHPERYENSMS